MKPWAWVILCNFIWRLAFEDWGAVFGRNRDQWRYEGLREYAVGEKSVQVWTPRAENSKEVLSWRVISYLTSFRMVIDVFRSTLNHGFGSTSLNFLSFVANPCSHPHFRVGSTLRYKGRRPVAEVLRSLRRAQAEAVTNQLQMTQGVEEIESQVPWRQATISAGKTSTSPESTQILDYSLGCFKIEESFQEFAFCHCSMVMWWLRLVVYYARKPLQDGFWLQLCLEKAKVT